MEFHYPYKLDFSKRPVWTEIEIALFFNLPIKVIKQWQIKRFNLPYFDKEGEVYYDALEVLRYTQKMSEHLFIPEEIQKTLEEAVQKMKKSIQWQWRFKFLFKKNEYLINPRHFSWKKKDWDVEEPPEDNVYFNNH